MIIERIERPVLNPEGVKLFFIIPAISILICNFTKADKQFLLFNNFTISLTISGFCGAERLSFCHFAISLFHNFVCVYYPAHQLMPDYITFIKGYKTNSGDVLKDLIGVYQSANLISGKVNLSNIAGDNKFG